MHPFIYLSIHIYSITIKCHVLGTGLYSELITIDKNEYNLYHQWILWINGCEVNSHKNVFKISVMEWQMLL